MPYVASIGTYLPCWGAPEHRVPGDDEEPGTISIGDRGRLALRRVAVRSGVPDYGYAFEPGVAA